MQRRRPVFATVMAGAFLVALGVATHHSAAQAVSSDAIVESLTPRAKTRSLTRSISGPREQVSQEDREFLRQLGTRGIRIDRKDREKLDEIAKKADLPSIDIEITFDYDSAQIRADSVADVDELGRALSSEALKAYRIVLNGHTDAAGSEEYNQALSERRSQAVREYLVARFGIDPSRLISIGYGEERLKNPGDPLAAENRRVEVINLTQG